MWATGYSCEYNTVNIQAQSSSSIATYYLYRYEDTGSGLTYNLIQSNTTGNFTINDFYSDDTQYSSNYYVRGRSTANCWSTGYNNVGIDVLRPTAPTIIGDTDACYNHSALLTVSGGYEGAYRWYDESSILIPGETASDYDTGPLTNPEIYYVSYLDEGYYGGQCESPRTQVNVGIDPLPEKPSTITSDVRRCETGMVTLEVWGHYNDFQWYDANDNALSGATTPTYDVQLDQLNNEKVYKVRGISQRVVKAN